MSRNPFRTRWIIWYVILIHFIWAFGLLSDASSSQTTAVAKTATIFGGAIPTAFFYMSASAMSLVALLRDRHDPINMVMMLVQQGALVLSASGAWHAVVSGQFADAVQRPRWFLINDQVAWLILAVLHMLSILEPYLRALLLPHTSHNRRATDRK